MNQQIVIIITSRVVVMTWLLLLQLGIANAKIDLQPSSRSTSSSQYLNEHQPSPGASVHRNHQQQLDDDDDSTLSWLTDYKRSYYATRRPYSFNYVVNNDVDDHYYSHRQASDGRVTTGSYRVLLPDGRTQIVDFTADSQNGYVAHVKYDQVLSFNSKKSSAVNKSLNYKKTNKKIPWTAFPNQNHPKNHQLTSYKADLIAAFRLKIKNQLLTSSQTDVDNVIAEQTPIHEAKAVYHQQSDDINIDKTTTLLLTPIHYRANHQPINQTTMTTTTYRNGYDYVAPTTYRPAIPYYYKIPKLSSTTRQSSRPAYWTWSTTTSAPPVNYKQPAADYLNDSHSKLPTPLIFRTARHNSLERSDYSSNDLKIS